MRSRTDHRLFVVLTVLAIFALVSTALAAPGTLKSENWPVLEGLKDYAVLRVIDGDTIDVEMLGTVRYIGVDTPETKHPQKPAERMGQEAYEANRRPVEGKRVKLEFDVEQRSRYWQVLAYVYVGDTPSKPSSSRPRQSSANPQDLLLYREMKA